MAEFSDNLEKTDSDSVGGKVSGKVGEKTLICEPCQEDGVENPAVKWCTDCKDHLCKTCVEHHQKAKPSRNHVLVSSDETPERKELCVSKKKNPCKLHEGQEITSFCNLHQQLCCSKCIATSHSLCIGVENIEGMVQNVDEWEVLVAFTDKLKKVISKYEEKKKTAIATAEYLNESAEDAMLKLNIMKSKDVKNYQKIEQTCDTVLVEIRSFQEALSKAQNAKNKIKVFTLLKSFANGVDFMDKNSANVDPALQFGQYRVTKQPKIPLLIKKVRTKPKETINGMCCCDCKTLVVIQEQQVTVIDISTEYSNPINVPNCSFPHIVVKASYNGQLVVSNNSHLLIFSTPVGKPRTKIPVPFSATLVECYNEAIIVQNLETGDIQEIDYSGNIRKTLVEKADISTCYAFDENTGSLFASGSGLKEFTHKGSVRTLVNQEDLYNVTDMIFAAGELFVVGVKKNTRQRCVYTVSMNGDLTTFISYSYLKADPRCLAFDKQYRLLFVCCQNEVFIFCM